LYRGSDLERSDLDLHDASWARGIHDRTLTPPVHADAVIGITSPLGTTMLSLLNDNKFFLGIMLLLLNVGSRHLVDEFSIEPKEYSRNLILRRMAIFAVCFVGTRDLVISLLLTAGFVILAQGVSSRSREGMKNREQFEIKEAVQTAYDPAVPPLFKA
jgi:hypothetical protein